MEVIQVVKCSKNKALPVAIKPDVVGTDTSFSERWKVVQQLKINCDVYADERECYWKNPVKPDVV